MAMPPVVINSFNQPTYLKQMINFLTNVNVDSIIVLDQNSSSEELIDYYDHIRKYVTVVELKKNLGPHWFFMGGMAFSMPRFYVYTDPDLKLNSSLSKDFLEEMMSMARDLGAAKIGMSLDISNIEDTIVYDIEIGGKKYTSIEWEEQFWRDRVPHKDYEIYKAPVDTTFCLYDRSNFDQSLHHYRDVNLYDCMDTPRSFRVAGSYAAIHLPWSKSDPMTQSEWEFYRSTAIKIHNY